VKTPFKFLLMLYLLTSCKGQFYEVEKYKSSSTIIKRGKIESVLFSKDAECFLCNLAISRFTPTLKEINQAEIILQKNIKAANYPIYNQGNGCPVIHKNLKKYKRQYFGYMDGNGNKLLYVNFLWAKYTLFDQMKGFSKADFKEWKDQLVFGLDGCSHFWQIHINLTKQKLENLQVNGSA